MLDDLEKISEIDKSNMLETIAQFPRQIKEAIEIAKNAKIDDFIKIDNVIITGMGASGISGDIVASLFRDKIDVPIYINREYDLPKWAKKDTLTIFFSYSGNTEETLSSFKIASQKKCKIVSISSGGKLQEMSEKRGIAHIKIPSGFQPRAAIAYPLFVLIWILKRTGLLKNNIESDIEETIAVIQDLIDNNKKSVVKENNLSKQIAKKIYNTIPQIYGWGVYYPIATRWRQQFNENSKAIAREDVVSESNHNDIVGWSSNPDVSKNFSCILFRDKDNESLNISTRLNFMISLFEDSVANVIEIYPKGRSRLAKIMYIMCLGDFLSCYLAFLRNIDPTPVDIITELKQRLAET
ncbi:MAG: bifunctional phosphoglucose/phosphomannose isomerase [Thermoplasmatales archaeon]|nr:MAG: bifunctional phosphoglucose/phosphomannose isomerase [Thermoplasmatales archaeon]